MEYDNSILNSVACDMMNLRYEKISKREMDSIATGIKKLYDERKIVDFHYVEKTGKTEYRHNWNIKTGIDSGGAVFISWHHNSSKPSVEMTYDMKIEFNPSKLSRIRKDTEIYEMETFLSGVEIFHLLEPICKNKIVRVIEFDIAIDFEISMQQLVSLPLKGRYLDLHKGTRYYGTKHKDMYLKIYDKQKERKEKANEDIGTVLTRLEVSVRPNNGQGCTFRYLKDYFVPFDTIYSIALYNDNIKSGMLKASVLAILNGDMQFKDFNQREKKKIVDCVENEMTIIPMNNIILENWGDIIEPIGAWCFNSSKDEKAEYDEETGELIHDDFMERLKYNNNEEWLLYVQEQRKLELASEQIKKSK